MRSITVFLQSKNKKERFDSSVTTWGELREVLESKGLLESTLKYTMVPGKLTLESPLAELHNGDITIIATPISVKSGAVDLVQFMGSLREKVNDAFSEAIDELEAGDYGDPDDSDGNSIDELKKLANELGL
jgi:hypothetical protein